MPNYLSFVNAIASFVRSSHSTAPHSNNCLKEVNISTKNFQQWITIMISKKIFVTIKIVCDIQRDVEVIATFKGYDKPRKVAERLGSRRTFKDYRMNYHAPDLEVYRTINREENGSITHSKYVQHDVNLLLNVTIAKKTSKVETKHDTLACHEQAHVRSPEENCVIAGILNGVLLNAPDTHELNSNQSTSMR